jgi:thiol-disulfide isomerase/thioredoxin
MITMTAQIATISATGYGITQQTRADVKHSRFIATLILLWATTATADIKVGDHPNLNFTSIDGQKINLTQYKGKIVLVDFWAGWSPQSVQNAPHLVKVNDQYKEKGLQIIGVNLDESADVATQNAKNVGFTWPQACDGGIWKSAYVQSWSVTTLPTDFIIDPNGVLVWMGNSSDLDKPLAEVFLHYPLQLLNPKVLTEARADLNQIDKLVAAAKPEDALAILLRIPPGAMADDKIAARVRDVQQNLQDGATAMIGQVDALAQAGKYSEAVAKLNAVIKGLSGTPAADQAQHRLDDLMNDPDARKALDRGQRDRDSVDWLNEAEHLQAAGDDMAAYKRFKQIIAAYPETPAATSAQQAVSVYEQDPTFLQKVKDASVADKAKAALSLADSYRRSGRSDLARQKYQSVIDQFPGTQYADTAKATIAAMDAAGGN